jgi:tetratricopeptide (TPR) repeat protein
MQRLAAAALTAMLIVGAPPVLNAQSMFNSATPTPAPSLAFAAVGNAMQLQAKGQTQLAIEAYMAAIGALNPILQSGLPPGEAKAARDHMAYSVAQLAILQRGHANTQSYLSYAYGIEKQYLGYEVARADELFARRQFADAFAIWRTFSVRAGDDRASGRPKRLYVALDAAVRGDYHTAAVALEAMTRETFQYGHSEPLFLLGEVERAEHRDDAAIGSFWSALSDQSEMVSFGLWGSQICAAGALANK